LKHRLKCPECGGSSLVYRYGSLGVSSYNLNEDGSVGDFHGYDEMDTWDEEVFCKSCQARFIFDWDKNGRIKQLNKAL